MRLLIVGTLLGYITEAGRIALDRGAKVAHAETIDQALHALRNGKGADLVMVDVKLDLAKLVEASRCPSSPAASARTRRPRCARSAPEPRNICRCRPTRN
jgi:hypothetical protein